MKKEQLDMLSIVLCVMLISGFMPHAGRPIDAAHAHSVAKFHLFLIVVCVPGIIWTWFARKRIIAATPAPTLTPAIPEEWGEPLATAFDDTSLSDQWKANIGSYRADPRLVAITLSTPTIFFVLVYLAGKDKSVAHTAEMFALCYGGWIAFTAALLWLMLKQRFPTRTAIRRSSVSLYRAGYVDVTATVEADTDGEPKKILNAFVPWADVKEIKVVDGDVFFVNGASGRGNFVSQRAFADFEAAKAFVDAAHSLQASPDMPARPVSPPPVPGVWPPPPTRR